jgi:hypothetical protein
MKIEEEIKLHKIEEPPSSSTRNNRLDREVIEEKIFQSQETGKGFQALEISRQRSISHK